MRLAGEEELHGTLRVVHDGVEAVKVGEEQGCSLVGGETPSKTYCEHIGTHCLLYGDYLPGNVVRTHLRVVEPLVHIFEEFLLDEHPYDYDAWVCMGRIYRELSLYEKAVEACEYALAIDENLIDAYVEKSNALMDLDNLGEATQTLHEILQKTSDDEDRVVLNMSLAEKFLHVANYSTAAVYLRNVINIDPECDFAHHDLSCCYSQLGDFISAEKHALKALNLSSDNINYYLSLGELYNNFAKPEKAEPYFRDAIALEKNNELPWIAYCEFLLSNDMFEETIQTIEYALHHIGDSFETHRILGTAYFLVGRKKEAYMVIENCFREYGQEMMETFFECCPIMLSDENILYIVNKLN